MKKTGILLVLVSLFALTPALSFALDKRKVMYMGGTLNQVKEKSEGQVSTEDPQILTLRFDKIPEPVAIPYERITELEYGQKAGHRVKTAILLSPLALFSKSRHHYLTITYKDANDAEQAAVLEFGKEIARTRLKVIETRAGKKIVFTDADSEKNFLK